MVPRPERILVLVIVASTLPNSASGLRRTTVVEAPTSCPDRCACTSKSGVVEVSCPEAGLTAIPVGVGSVSAAIASFDVSGNRLESLTGAELGGGADPDGAMAWVETVATANFSRNRVETIQTGAFGRWRSLESLDLSANRLSSIDHGTFSGAARTSLQNLDLSGNRLTDIDGGFSGMSNLNRLDLRNNYITALTEFTFRDLTALRYLFLTSNRIYRIDRRAFRRLGNLLHLVMKANPLADVDRFHFDAGSLSSIDLSECGLVGVPRGLPDTVRYLQLRRNNLTALDAQSFIDVPQANIVVLDENRIETVAEATFARMRSLQQLWLSDNRLTELPHPLPASLRRLLVDANRIRSIDADAFPVRSHMTTLSLLRNQLASVSPDALRRLVQLQSLDLSDNRLTGVDTRTFANNTQLRSLSLAKNPLRRIDAGAFDGLRSLKSLALSYVPTPEVRVGDRVLRPLAALAQLDLDNSPGLAAAFFDGDQPTAADVLPSVEELGLTNSDLTSVREDFPARLPRLAMLRLSSARWRCDERLRWLRDWLADATIQVRIPGRAEMRCASPEEVSGRPIASLNDDEFAAAPSTTTTKRTTSPSPPPSSAGVRLLPTKTPTTKTTTRTSTTTPGSSASTSAAAETRTSGPDDRQEDLADDDDLFIPDLGSNGPAVDGDDEEIESLKLESRTVSASFRLWPPPPPPSSSSPDERHLRLPTPTSADASAPSQRPRPDPGSGNGASASVAGNDDVVDDDDDQLFLFKMRVIIAVATVGATIIIAALIVVGIVYVCRGRRNRKSPPPPPVSGDDHARTFIKYKNKNGVLYFSTPVDAAPSTSAVTGDDEGRLIGAVDRTLPGSPSAYAQPVGAVSPGYNKTRVYKWEDF